MATTAFKASEKFRVTMVNSEGGSERVTVQLSLDGLKILNQDGSRTMRIYNLRNVARWDLMDTSTVIWTKTDVDLEEKPLTLSADQNTIRNVVDTLASCCMQLAEVIANKEEAANLEELAAGGGRTRKAQKLPSVDSVEFWRNPDKASWLQSQSEVMKIWRRRWFVLKQGYLFRFLSPDVSESVKPRGVVDLSKVQDVRDGRAVTGKANTVQLKTANGESVCYVCESETEMVEWISALEGAIAKIVKQLAGVDDSNTSSSERHGSSRRKQHDRHGGGGGSSSSSASEWAKQVERSLSQGSGSRRSGYQSSSAVVGYASSGSGSGGRASAPTASYDSYGISDYSQISGAAGVAAAMDDLTLNYGGYQRPAAAPPAAAGGGGGGGSYSGGSYGYGGGSTNAYGSGSSNTAPYAGSSTNAYGGSTYGGTYGSSPAGGYGSSPAGGYGSSAPAAGYGAGSGSSGYPEAGGYYGGATVAAPSYPDQAAAGGYGAPNGYGGYQQPQQQQQQPQQQQQQPVAADYYGAAGGYYQQQPAPQQQQQQQATPQQQQQQQPGVSLIDQVPSQQPAYPYYQAPAGQEAAAAAAAPPAPAAPSTWQVHHTAEGRPYYYNSATGTTQWEAPPGLV